jgi:hypothetical protein
MRRISVFNLNLCDEKRLIPRALEGRRDATRVAMDASLLSAAKSYRVFFPSGKGAKFLFGFVSVSVYVSVSISLTLARTPLVDADVGQAHERDVFPVRQGVVVFSMSDVPLGFGVAAKSTQDCRKLDASSIVAFHQADVGEYLRAEDDMVQGKKE